MPLFVHNQNSVSKTLEGTSVIVPAETTLNLTSEFRNLTVSQRRVLEKQRNKFLVYKWVGSVEYNTFPLRTQDYEQETQIAELRNELQESKGLLLGVYNCHRICCLAMSGDIQIDVGPAMSISAAELNAALAGTLKRTFAAKLVTSKGEIHDWATGSFTITPSEAVADADVAAPTTNLVSPTWDKGRRFVIATLDTDANVTKTYLAGQSVAFLITDTGPFAAFITPVTKTFNVV